MTGERRFVVMYGVPSGVVWDPAGDGVVDAGGCVDGFLIAAGDIALARPPLPLGAGRRGHRRSDLDLARSAGEPAQARCSPSARSPGTGSRATVT